MKKEFCDPNYLKQIFCHSSSSQYIPVSEDMIDDLFEDGGNITLMTYIGKDLRDAIGNLSLNEIKQAIMNRAVVLVRSAAKYSMLISELSSLSEVLDSFPEDVEIGWGVDTSEECDSNIKLFIAFSSK